jgi:putative SOS response-associated peptidase YedK
VKDSEKVVARFIHDEANDAWMLERDGSSTELFRYAPDGTIQATLQSGNVVTVTNDEAGLQRIREAVAYDNCFAMK